MGGGARVSDFFYKESKSKKKRNKKKIIFWGEGGEGWWWGRWTVRRTGPNQFAPSTSLRLGALQCINVQVMALESTLYDHFII